MYQSNYETIGAGRAPNSPGAAVRGTNAREAYSYDYVTIETNEKFALEYVDAFEALGFELVKNERALALKTALTFKRDRKIQNKDQLDKIKLKLCEALSAMNKLELEKTKLPFTAAVALGTAGSLSFGGGMCLCLLNGAIGAIIGGVALGLIGLGLAGAGYLVYKRLHAKKSLQINTLIDKKRDEISLLCEEAQKHLK